MIETERLILRRFEDEDAKAIHALRSDANFMRFIKTPETRRQAQNWMHMVSKYWETKNFGFWAIVLKENKQVIGWNGTWTLAETGEPEIGFAVARKFAGKGLATEAAGAALRFSFENRLANRTVALSYPENMASRRVMEKIGMRFVEQRYFDSYGKTLAYYRITKEEYARNSQAAHA